MDQMIKSNACGEIGIDSEASPGQGQYYAKTYDGSYDSSGFDSAEEAWEELEFVCNMFESQLEFDL